MGYCHDDSKESRSDKLQESTIKNSIDRVFNNTNKAIEYGEKASYEEMIELMRKYISQFSQTTINLSTDVQLLNEAYHAFSKDKWYKYNVERHKKDRL